MASIRKQNAYQYRVRITAGGNILEHCGKKSTESASLKTIKILLNSVLPKNNSPFVVADIGKIYLDTKLQNPEYIRIHTKLIPEEIIDDYNVT